jgi:hypothetical protein
LDDERVKRAGVVRSGNLARGEVDFPKSVTASGETDSNTAWQEFDFGLKDSVAGREAGKRSSVGCDMLS